MKQFSLLLSLAVALSWSSFAAEPSLSVYQIITGDKGSAHGELIMKLNNPAKSPLYTFSFGITGLPVTYEVKKKGQWVALPGQGWCLTCAAFYPVLPESYVVFATFPPPSILDHKEFRVTLRVGTAPPSMSPHAAKKAYLDIASEKIETKTLIAANKPRANPPGKSEASPSTSLKPSLSVYERLPQDMEFRLLGEVVLKINNPPGRTYYNFGAYITNVHYLVEVERNGKWVPEPEFPSESSRRMRPFLPDSYLLFDIYKPFESDPEAGNLKFRVRAFLYADPTATPAKPTGATPDEGDRPYIELVSETMNSKDFEGPTPPPQITGLSPIPAAP